MSVRNGFIEFKELVEQGIRTTQNRYYNSKDYTDKIFENVGFKDLAVEMNSRFALDIYSECEKEFKRTGNILAFQPIHQLHYHFFDVIEKCIKRYQDIKNKKDD